MIKPAGPSLDKVGAVTPGSPVERVRGDVGRLLMAAQAPHAPGPGFVVGEAVSARLVEPLQGRQWLAVVKNTVITLQWPANTAVPTQGGTLALQVASLTPRLSFVLADAAPPAPAHGAVAVQLSAAAQSLNALVQAGAATLASAHAHAHAHAHAPAHPHAPVLLGDPAAPPAERAQAVAQAIVHSGLFYESHLLAWAEGRMPLASLSREPQAQRPPHDAPAAAREAASAELGGVLQRQLDALDGKPLAFAGFAWPGQPAQWSIERDPPDARDDEPAERSVDGKDEPETWTTQIRLDLPRLGALGAQLRVAGTQVTLAMTFGSADGASLLATHRGRLAAALQAAGLTLATLTVQATDPPHEAAEKA